MCWCWWRSSGLPGFPVLAFLVWNVFVAALVPEMAAGCSPEVTLVSVDRAASPRTGQRGGKSQVNSRRMDRQPGEGRGRCLPGSHARLLCGRDARLQWDGEHPGRATVGVAHDQPGVLDVETLRDRRDETRQGSEQTADCQRTGESQIHPRRDTHVQFLHGAGGHAGALEVDKGTESLVQHSDAFYLAVPTRQVKRVIKGAST